MRLADLLQPAPKNENWKRTPATVATVATVGAEVSRKSQVSQGVTFENHFSDPPTAPATAPEPPQVPQPTRGNVIPMRRAVTCAACLHELHQANTSSAGLHPCGLGHGWHFANYPHACADWKPRP